MPASATSAGAAAPVSPLCSLYGVTVTTEVLTREFNSPSLSLDLRKWPLLMAQAKAARKAFSGPPLLPVRPRYDSLVRRLGRVGVSLGEGHRAAAHKELEAAVPDLDAVLAVAKRAHLVCKSGSIAARIA